MMYNIRGSAIRWQIHDFLSDGNSNVCSISRLLRDIGKINKMQKFALGNEGQVQGREKWDLRHLTRNFRDK